MVGRHRGQMPARRPAADKEPLAIETEIVGALAQRRQRPMDLADDLGQARVRRQRVADQRDVDPVRSGPSATKANMSLSLRCQ